MNKVLEKLSWTWIKQKFGPHGIWIIGMPQVTFAISVVAAVALWWQGNPRAALAVLATEFAHLITEIIKLVWKRPRPDTPHNRGPSVPTRSSFPSGDAAASAALYPFLGYIAYRSTDSIIGLDALLGGIALATAIGMSRWLRGAHWFTDVLAGWAIGGVTAYALAAWLY